MPVKESYDFLDFTSFPSSFRLDSDTGGNFNFVKVRQWGWFLVPVTITKPSKIRLEVNMKVLNGVAEEPAWVAMMGVDTTGRDVDGTYTKTLDTYYPAWMKLSAEVTMPETVKFIEVRTVGAGSGVKGKVASTKYDDLKVYQDDKLIYDNYFTALRPGKIIPTVWTPPERIIGAWQRFKTGEPMALFKPPRLLTRI